MLLDVYGIYWDNMVVIQVLKDGKDGDWICSVDSNRLIPKNNNLNIIINSMKLGEDTTECVYGGYNDKVSIKSLTNTYKKLTHFKCNKHDMKIKREYKRFCKTGIEYCKKNNINELLLEWW